MRSPSASVPFRRLSSTGSPRGSRRGRRPPSPPRLLRAASVAAVACLLLLVGLPAPAAAQQGAVTGQITDAEDQSPVDGAQVFVAGTGIGTITGADGQYRLTDVPAGEQEVRVQVLGYQPASRTLSVESGQSVTADFTLQVSAVSMEEMVVTATGVQRQRELGHAVSKLDMTEQVEMSRPTSVQNMLQAQSPGMTINQSTGSVGASSQIRIRGRTSLSFSNRPLVYIDGARISTGTPGSSQQGQSFSRLSDLNPEDIESVEVVKGPAAATLYGTEAAAGVIRITTRSGSTGAPNYTIEGSYGQNWNSTGWLPRVFHPRSFLGDGARDTLYTYNALEDQDPFRTGDAYSVSGNVRGGEESITYFLSGRWQDEAGTFPNNDRDQWNVRGNFSIVPENDILDLTVSNGFTSSFTRLPDNDNNIAGFIPIAQVASPWAQPMERNGVRTCPLNIETSRLTGTPLSDLGFAGCAETGNFGGRTFEQVASRENRQDVERYVGSATLRLNPFEEWSTRLTVGYDQFAQRTRILVPVDPARPFGEDSEGNIARTDVTSRDLTVEMSSSVDLDLTENLSSVTTFGGQWIRETADGTFAEGTTFPAGTPSVGSSVVNEGGDQFGETRTLGSFVQQQLSWKDRIFVTPGVRLDNNSAFGENLGVQDLKKINGSWVVSEEPWFPVDLNSLRLRAAWGESSKLPGTNSALSLLSPVPAIRNGTEVLGVLPDRPGNPDLRPETSDEFEIGFDLSAVNDRVGLEFTYYDNETTDAVVARNLAPSTGFPNQQFTNVGEIQNHGIEATLDLRAVDRSDLTWTWNVNFSTSDNTVTELPEPIIVDFGNDSNAGQRIQEGFSFGAYMWRPLSLGPDGSVVVGDTLEEIGQPTPSWEGSVGTSLRLFDRVRLYGSVDFKGGFETMYNTASFTCNLLGGGAYGGTCPDLFHKNPDGTPTDEARIKQRAAQLGNEAPWVESSGFAKLRTLSLRFELPERWAGLLGANTGALTFTGNNLATWDSFSGPDPEVNEFGGDETVGRSVFLTEPQSRRFTTSLQLSF